MTTPVEYAETKLGVHTVYAEALEAQADLDNLATELDTAQDNRRKLAEQIADREAALQGEMWSAHATESATWLKEHMSQFKREDVALKALRELLLNEQSTVAGLEYDMTVKQSQVRILSARMDQQGGYLNYLAAVMNREAAFMVANQTQSNPQEQGPNGD